MTNTSNNPTPEKNNKTTSTRQQKIEKIWHYLPLISLVLLLILIISQQTQQTQIRQIAHAQQQSQQSVTATADQLQQKISDLTKDSTQPNTAEVQKIQSLLQKNQQDLTEQLQKLLMHTKANQEQLKQLSDQFDSLATQVANQPATSQDDTPDTISSEQQAASKTADQSTDLPISKQYHIAKVTNYGVVVQSNETGQFYIAHIGQSLPGTGPVTLMTTNYLVAGGYKITADHSNGSS